MLQQNEPYSKLKIWFYNTCYFVCWFEIYNTMEEFEQHFNKHIVSFCNNPKADDIKSCRKLSSKLTKKHSKIIAK